MEMNSLGLIEMTSIAAGMQAADIMLKTSQVELILARTICRENILFSLVEKLLQFKHLLMPRKPN